MYAIIADGSHQYRVEEGQTLEIERQPSLSDDAATMDFDRVLFIGDHPDGSKIGHPTVDGAKVTASVVGEVKGQKIIIQKLRRRKNYRLKKGHRQKYLRIRIDKIEA